MATAKRTQTVHVGKAWRIILNDLGFDEQSVLRQACLALNTFEGDGTFISVAQAYSLYEVIDELSDDPTLSLKTGSIASVELFDPALFAALCSLDMNSAATRLGQFKRLVGAFSLEVNIQTDITAIRYRCKYRPDVPRILGLSELIFLVAFARRATRHSIKPRRFVVQELPDSIEPYEKFLGCAIAKGEYCEVEFDATDAKRPFLTHDAKMLEEFELGLQRRMAKAELASISEQVAAALLNLLPSGRTQLQDAAREIAISSRTLQRRLSAEGTTWIKVLNETREQLAQYYLENSEMSLAEISFLLGYEDPNSLFRAFHRWTGTTPESWREDARAS